MSGAYGWCLPLEIVVRSKPLARLINLLAREYPAAIHVRDVGLSAADDQVVWEYAAEHGLTIVTKDSDFQQRALLFGHPLKVVWVRLGNCATAAIAVALRVHHDDIVAFDADPTAAFLVLSSADAWPPHRAPG